jgi:hypothetical protein
MSIIAITVMMLISACSFVTQLIVIQLNVVAPYKQAMVYENGKSGKPY